MRVTGAKLDASLESKAHPERPLHISKSRALKRFHWNMSLWDNTQYRFSLIMVIINLSLCIWKSAGAGISAWKSLSKAEEAGATAGSCCKLVQGLQAAKCKTG